MRISPLGVYRQWKHWCHFPGYWFDDAEISGEMGALFARVRVPITTVNAVDDRWAPAAAHDAFFPYYVTCELTTRDLHPGESGRSNIGHMGYLRRGSEPLRSAALDELGQS